MDQDRIVALLTDIRDSQREQLAEYRRIAGRSLALAEQSHVTYATANRLWRRWILFGAITIAALVALVVYLFSKVLTLL